MKMRVVNKIRYLSNSSIDNKQSKKERNLD